MTKQDVIQQIGQRIGQDPVTTRAVIESFFQVVKHHVSQGNAITIRGFGAFEAKQRAAKLGRNINQHTTHPIVAQVIPRFKPSAEFKAQVRAWETTASQPD